MERGTFSKSVAHKVTMLKVRSAIRHGNGDKIERMLHRNPELLSAKDRHGWSIVHYAASYDEVDILRLAIVRKGNVNVADEHGVTPLIIAVEEGNLDCVQALLDAGADTSVKYMELWSLVHLAAASGHPAVLRVLVENAGLDPTAKDELGMTPMHCAAENDNAGVVKLLLSLGAEPSVTDSHDRTPLQIAQVEHANRVIDVLQNPTASE